MKKNLKQRQIEGLDPEEMNQSLKDLHYFKMSSAMKSEENYKMMKGEPLN